MIRKRAMSHELRAASSSARTSRTRHSRLATRDPRRGILLLVVLSILTLFLLIGTAFIVTSKQYQQTNKTRARLTETANSSIDQQDLLNEVLNQLVRDTNNQNSSLRFHSLLRDMYGNDGIYGQLFDTVGQPNFEDTLWAGGGTNGGVTGGQIIEFRLAENTNALPELLTDQYGIPITLSSFDHAYNGRVLTFLDGPARGVSARIVGYLGENRVLRVLTPRLADGSTLNNPAILDGSRIAINGRPFNGTGFGYDHTPLTSGTQPTPKLTAGEALLSSHDPADASLHYPTALMPNSAFFNPVNMLAGDYLGGSFSGSTHQVVWDNLTVDQQTLITRLHFGGTGGSDESYDAVDFQNMLLALLQTNAVETVLPDLTATDPEDLGNMIIPSAHRPALLNYWRRQLSGASIELQNEPNLLRKVLLRPSWIDHPNFDGSNPDFANATNNVDRLRRMIYGPWDVDNDLDGIRDSVWIDAGLPVMENHDGRLVKPLVSMLVVDMDGRLNLNAHGSEDIANSIDFYQQTRDRGLRLAGFDANSSHTTDILPPGQGYGPAEISLGPLMPVQISSGFAPMSAEQIRLRRWFAYQRFVRGAERNEPIDILEADKWRAAPFNAADLPRFRRRVAGKYGQRTTTNTNPLPGIDDITVFDIAGQLKMQGVPTASTGMVMRSGPDGEIGTNDDVIIGRGGYSTLPDFRARYGLGLDALGRPVSEALVDDLTETTRLDANTPYEMDLSLGAARGESQTAPDGPYTVAELERILRPYDSDAGALPSRIWEMAGEFKSFPNDTVPNLDTLNLWRTTVTTDSYDLPVPSVVVPGWMRLGPDGIENVVVDPADFSDDFEDVVGVSVSSATFADLLRYRMHLALNPNNPANLTDRVARNIRDIHLSRLLPPDLANGVRLDLNRPLGNGRDDNNNGVVDEPGEVDTSVVGGRRLEAPYWASESPELADFTGAAGRFRDERILFEDRNNNGRRPDDPSNPDMDDLAALRLNDLTDRIDESEELIAVHNMRRQLLARDLYVLAMTLADPIPIPTGGTTNPNYPDYLERRARQAEKLAQWAINVVDFRDPDNIMTAFEYDVDPFDGWGALNVGIDGSLTTRADIFGADQKPGGSAGSANFDLGGVVWGAESPELLMTETLAWHDRKTVDTQREGEAALNDQGDSGQKADVNRNALNNDDPYDASEDQRERPQGIAMIELYCPLPTNPAASADTHLIADDGTDLGINIAAVAQDPNNQDVASPVWRMMVYKRGGPGRLPEDPDEDNRPTDLRGRPNADRSVYFAGFDPETAPRPGITPRSWDEDGVAFYNEFDERYAANRAGLFSDPVNEKNRVLSVRPGRYMVVGGGVEVAPGEYLAEFGRSTDNNARRGIWLRMNSTGLATEPTVEMSNASGVTATDAAGFTVAAPPDPENGAATRPLSLSSVAIINQTAVNPTPGSPRIFNVSEPAGGYPRSVDIDSAKGGSNSAWDETQQQYVPILDIPLDEQRFDQRGGGGINDPIRQLRGTLFDGDTRLALPADDQGERTIPGFSWVYLQRLANPLLPWNPPAVNADGLPNTESHDPNLAVNPYLTVDSMGVNVTVFNGLAKDEAAIRGGEYKRYSNNASQASFASVQRGRFNNLTEPYDGNVSALEGQIQLGRRRGLTRVPPAVPDMISNLYAMERIQRESYWANRGGPNGTGQEAARDSSHYFEALPDHTLGFLNEPFRRDNASSKIEPGRPFPWLTWNNRPFANAGELMMVPAFGGLDLLQTFSYDATSNQRTETFSSDGNQATQSDNVVDLLEELKQVNSKLTNTLEVDGRFGHLLNFFRNGVDNNGTATDQTDDKGVAGLYRIFDYVHVPSPFVSSETWLNPIAFGNDTVSSTEDPRYLLQPPFNKVSEFREPGRMNLNTITSAHVWDGGVMHRELSRPELQWSLSNNYQRSWLNNGGVGSRVYGHSGPLFIDAQISGTENQIGLMESRRGFPGVVTPDPTDVDPEDTMLLLNADMPTFFANPFRAADSVDLVPTDLMLLDRYGESRLPVQATILRNEGTTPLAGTLTEVPPTLAASVDTDAEFNNADRNPYFRYQPISRLSSMTTNRSNVYAVWVTIGFFEVQPAPDRDSFANDNGFGNDQTVESNLLYDRVYPEGFTLGKEAGADTGDIRRVREFAMIDRTIPVAFEPGQNHNIDKAIRLRRRLE